ncbi:MAG: EscU/YscU/HrcU family type III secretion system export apparatus switch protein [Rubripirellula sp.]|nr:EscU/YscU/HrcU family type III secretion system export apparatus switch protein [Rubripirellula sp.]
MSGEKKHPATERHRQKAKAEGRCAKSHDLTSSSALVVAFVGLWFLGPSVSGQLMSRLTDSLTAVSIVSFDSEQWGKMFSRGVGGYAKIVGPILMLMCLTIVAASCGQTGLLFLTKRVRPDIRKISPANGFQRIVSFAGTERLVFGLLKIVVVLVVAWIAIKQGISVLSAGWQSSLETMTVTLVGFFMGVCLKVALVLLGLAVLDYFIQQWKHEKDLMMTDQELREEMRETEGDRGVFTQRYRQKKSLPQASQSHSSLELSEIVINSGAGLAVSIGFDSKQRSIPKLLKKGFGEHAEAINRYAQEQGIVVAKQAALANALHALVEEGQVIPLHLRRDLSPLLR